MKHFTHTLQRMLLIGAIGCSSSYVFGTSYEATKDRCEDATTSPSVSLLEKMHTSTRVPAYALLSAISAFCAHLCTIDIEEITRILSSPQALAQFSSITQTYQYDDGTTKTYHASGEAAHCILRIAVRTQIYVRSVLYGLCLAGLLGACYETFPLVYKHVYRS